MKHSIITGVLIYYDYLQLM